MTSSLKAVALGLAVALLCVPAAFAKGGHGHGKPSWAGGGGGHGKPAWAGHGKTHELKAKHDKKAKHQKADSKAEDQASGDEELNLDDLNPAWQCFMVESMMDAKDAEAVAGDAEPGEFSSFDAKFGTNDNKRNSHGKCVSAAAQGQDVSAGLADEEQQSCDDAAEQGSDDATAGDDTTAGDDATAGEDATGGDEAAADDGSSDDQAGETEGDQAGETEGDDSGDQADDCQTGDQAEQDDQDSEDDQAGEADPDATDAQGEEAALARALVRFLGL
jgi:hypothetical protein